MKAKRTPAPTTGFVWTEGQYGCNRLMLNGVTVGESHWTSVRDDPKPNKGSICLGGTRDFEHETGEGLRQLVQDAVRQRIDRLTRGLTADGIKLLSDYAEELKNAPLPEAPNGR